MDPTLPGDRLTGGGLNEKRYSAPINSQWRAYGPINGVTSDQSLPTSALVLVAPNGDNVRWHIAQPAGASCRVHKIRRVYVPSGNASVAAVYDEIIDEGYETVTGPGFVTQVAGDQVGIYLTNIAGLGGGESISAYFRATR